jgi:PrtD family type I secretion system ABC transporter
MRGFLVAGIEGLLKSGPGEASRPAAARAVKLSVLTLMSSMRGALFGIAGFSGVINLLALTGSIFMLQVYDRVLPSQSVPTLVALMVVVAGLFLFQAALDVIRSRLLVRLASRIDEALGERTYRAVLELPLRGVPAGDGLQPIRDLDTVRNFLAGPGPTAILDLPWIPVYLIFVYMLHPLLGLLATFGAVLLLALTLLTDYMSRGATADCARDAQRRHALSAEGRKNAVVLRSMGFADRMVERWLAASGCHLHAQQQASDVAGGLGAFAKVFRLFLQSAILGLGAYLVIQGEVSGGVIIASSITSSRALSPIDLAISQWKSFLAARQSAGRVDALLRSPMFAVTAPPLPLPPPRLTLTVESLSATAPGLTAALVQNVSFHMRAGQGLGLIGPSAAGKSTLLRAIVGAWPILRGTVRLDGAALDQWLPAELGRHIGHLPQDVELFDGTISENIARFDPAVDPAAVLEAAHAANVHDMIVRLPAGYETRIGQDGDALSSGQRQRIGLARAFFGNPFLIVLDEPSANLDTEGEEALTKAIRGVRDRGGIIIVVTHRPSAIAALDILATMADGKMQYYGPKDEVLRRALRPPPEPMGAAMQPGTMVLASEAAPPGSNVLAARAIQPAAAMAALPDPAVLEAEAVQPGPTTFSPRALEPGTMVLPARVKK